MVDPQLEKQIQGAAAYEALFVPALFREWAPRLIDAVPLTSGQRVLDLACGTGIVARTAAARVAPGGSVVGVDPNAGMLAVAAQRAPHITWQPGRAESLPFPDGSFDAVFCQFGLMFFTDRRAALGEMLRVLTSRGHLALAVWDRLEDNPAYATVVAILHRIAGAPAADALRRPFALGDRSELAALLEQSGVTTAVITTRRGTARFPSVRTMVEADLRGWLPFVGVLLPEDQIREILATADRALDHHVAADGTVAFGTSAHLVSASRP
jgi:SAM-dependent methyltransferase